MRVKHHIKPTKIRGYGHGRCCVVKHRQCGGSIVGSILKGSLRFAKKHVTLNNIKKLGRVVLKHLKNEGQQLLKDNAANLTKTASDFATHQTKKMFEDIKKGKPVKEILHEQSKQLPKELKTVARHAKPTLAKSVKRVEAKLAAAAKTKIKEVKADLATPANKLLLSNILAGNGITPPKRRGRPKGSLGLKKRRQHGSGIQFV